jgi:hypothetical protein
LAASSPLAEVERLFDHLVGAGEETGRDRKAESLGRLQVEDELIVGRCLNRKIGRFGSFENAMDVIGRAPINVIYVRSVSGKTSARREVSNG